MSTTHSSPQQAQSDTFAKRYWRSLTNLDRDSLWSRVMHLAAAILPFGYFRAVFEGEMSVGYAAGNMLVSYLMFLAVYALLNFYWMRKVR